MNNALAENICRSFRLNLAHARNLLAGISAEQMVAQPAAGMNHPAWIVGHLAHSFEAIGGELGLASQLPGDWAERFGTGSRPAADCDSYPAPCELLAQFEACAQRTLDRLEQLSAADLNQPLPDVRYRHIFPTLGSAVLHILTVHMALHLGQLSAWRRAAGSQPVADPL